MNNDFLNKPLYPPNEYSSEKKQSKDNSHASNFSNIFSSLAQGGNSQLLSMILSMKRGKTGDVSNILSKNPLFDMLSTFDNNKKESFDGSPKKIPNDEFLN